MNIKNITTSAFCDCILRGEYYFTVISNFDCNLQCKNCTLSSNFEEEEITKSSLKIEEFVEA